jgi:hypothetical protein
MLHFSGQSRVKRFRVAFGSGSAVAKNPTFLTIARNSAQYVSSWEAADWAISRTAS